MMSPLYPAPFKRRPRLPRPMLLEPRPSTQSPSTPKPPPPPSPSRSQEPHAAPRPALGVSLNPSRSSSGLTVELFSVALWQKDYDYHQQQGLRADRSLEVKSTEQLVQYMMQERGWEEAAAREAISIYPARVLAKLHRKTLNGMPTVGQLRIVSDEEWEEKSR